MLIKEVLNLYPLSLISDPHLSCLYSIKELRVKFGDLWHYMVLEVKF
jgi:hypothetical protein